VTLTIHHDQHWGGGYQTIVIPAGTFSAKAHLKGWEDKDQTIMDFYFDSFHGQLPSFASVALNGKMTGDNEFTLLGGSAGTLNVVTGEVSAELMVGLKNSIFCNALATVGVQLRGKFDPSTTSLRIYRSGVNATKILAGAPGGSCESLQ
jgi:hypothetical protein